MLNIENMLPQLLEDLWTIQMNISGITISVITLLYSLAIGKKEELEVLNGVVKKGNRDPMLSAKIAAIIKYIISIKKTISSCCVILALSIANAILSWLSIRFYSCQLINGTIVILLLILIATISSLVRRLIKQYKKDLTV